MAHDRGVLFATSGSRAWVLACKCELFADIMAAMSLHGKPPKREAPVPLPARQRRLEPASPRLRWSSSTLLGGGREVEIEHEHVVYRLQLTSLGKLILTK